MSECVRSLRNCCSREQMFSATMEAHQGCVYFHRQQKRNSVQRTTTDSPVSGKITDCSMNNSSVWATMQCVALYCEIGIVLLGIDNSVATSMQPFLAFSQF